MKLCSGQCPHCRSGGNATAVHLITQQNRRLDLYKAHCAACGNEFDVEPGAYIKESKPLTTEQLRGDE